MNFLRATKKVLLSIMCFVLLCCLFACDSKKKVDANQKTAVDVSKYEYEIVDDVIRILSHEYDEDETQIYLPEEIGKKPVEILGKNAFYQHKHVTSIVLPNSLKSLGVCPFYRCYSLRELKIPAGVEEIDGNPVFRCSSLEKIEVDPENEFFSSVDGALFNKEQTLLIAYPEGKTAASYTIPETVTEIDGDAFGYHPQIKELTIPASVTVFPAGNMFVFPEDIVLYVESGSAAENYAKEYGFNYKITK